MNEVLKIILSLSLSGSLLILILFLLRPLFKERLSKQWQYYIWLVVIARLLLPFTPEISLMGELFQEIDRGVAQTELFMLHRQGSGTSVSEVDLPLENGIMGERDNPKSWPEEFTGLAETPVQNSLLVIGESLCLVWLVFGLILFIRKITIYQSFVKYIWAGCVEISDIDLLERFGKLTELRNVKKAVELYTNSLISSPLLIGFFRPCIVLPTADLSISDFQYTILHELTHYKRWDMFYKWLVQFTICLHWFNPMVHLISREVGRACELSCDEAVIKKLDAEGRRAYGDTLINAIGAGGSYKNSLVSVTLNESKELLKERLDAIMGFKRTNRLMVAISIALFVAACFGATAAGAYAASQPKQPITSIPSLRVKGNLTLVTKEYSMADIKSLNISGIIVKALSENVSITRSGETLKVEYYDRSQNDYILKKESDAGGTFEELVLRRATSLTSGDTMRPISITIPDNINFKVISVTTSSGNINLENCSGENVISQTQSGDIIISGGLASNVFAVETESGNAVISDFSANENGIDFKTKSGKITFNGQKYNGNDIKKESGNEISPRTRSDASDAEYNDWHDDWYDDSHDEGDISVAEREAYDSVRDIVHKAVLEAHREAHPGISFENCPECNNFNKKSKKQGP